MRIGVIVAMDKEFAQLQTLASDKKEQTVAGRTFVVGSIGDNEMRPGRGTRPAMILSSPARAFGPRTTYLPKFCTSLMPTPSRTARTSRAVASQAFERRKLGVS